MSQAVYRPDLSLRGKLRRRLVRLYRRRRLGHAPPPRMLTFTFDDVPRSAATTGARVIEAVGARATFYVCGGLVDTEGATGRLATARDLQRLAADGHEIGCHSFSHLDCGAADAASVTADLDRNARALARWALPCPRTFAYPYGDVGWAVKRLTHARFEFSRSVHRGVLRRGSDLNQAPAVAIDGPEGEASGRVAMRRAFEKGGWLVLCAHAVQPEPHEFAIAPHTLARLVSIARELDFEIVTARQGVDRLRTPRGP